MKITLLLRSGKRTHTEPEQGGGGIQWIYLYYNMRKYDEHSVFSSSMIRQEETGSQLAESSTQQQKPCRPGAEGFTPPQGSTDEPRQLTRALGAELGVIFII